MMTVICRFVLYVLVICVIISKWSIAQTNTIMSFGHTDGILTAKARANHYMYLNRHIGRCVIPSQAHLRELHLSINDQIAQVETCLITYNCKIRSNVMKT